MPLFTETITGDGIILADASVTIYDSAGILASLFSDAPQTVALANPLTSDINGDVSCYMSNGNYELVVTKAGYSEQRANIGFFPVMQNTLSERTVDANFTMLPTDGIIWVDALGNVVGTFPAIADIPAGNLLTIKNISAFEVSWITPDAALLNGAVASASPLTMPGESITVTHDGTGWQTV